MAHIFDKFSEMLANCLVQTAAQITTTIKADLQSLGARANQNIARIQDLQDQLDAAKIDDLENRSRRYNFHIRGLSDSTTDVHMTVKSFIKDSILNIADHRLELDTAHRALQPHCQDGLPRDIVVKLDFYAVKELIMKLSQETEQLTIQGHPIQIFADLSPTTIQKRKSLKPLLTALSQKAVKYWWSFPFCLQFQFPEQIL